MDRVRQNGGTFGILSAVVLAVLFILVLTSGFQNVVNDPPQALAWISGNSGRWTLTGVLGTLGSLLAVVFVAGLYRAFREKAPTRAYAVLLFGVLGSGGYALASLAQWLGGAQVAGTTDPVAAQHAWVAVNAIATGLNGMGNSFVGASLLTAGWVITGTRALSSGVGWLAYLAGIVALIGLFTAAPIIFLGSFALIIIFLAWAGYELRR